MDAGGQIAQKRFPCSFCNYSCDVRKDMIRHERTHTGEKPFKCKLCDKSFARKDHLVRHGSIHTADDQTKEKKFPCSF